jgi:hypothetical protein
MMRTAFAVEPVSKHGKVVSARIYSSGLAYDHMTLNGKQGTRLVYKVDSGSYRFIVSLGSPK